MEGDILITTGLIRHLKKIAFSQTQYSTGSRNKTLSSNWLMIITKLFIYLEIIKGGQIF
jgi:hypothetical protein